MNTQSRISFTNDMRINWLARNPAAWRYGPRQVASLPTEARQVGQQVAVAIRSGNTIAVRRGVERLRNQLGLLSASDAVLSRHLPGDCFCQRCCRVVDADSMENVDCQELCESCSGEARTCNRCGFRSFGSMTETADTGDVYCRDCRGERCHRWQDGRWRTTREPVDHRNREIGGYGTSRCERLSGGRSELPDTGFELEWIPRRNGDANEVASQVFARSGDYLGGIERDGSIGSWDGAECVTHYGPLHKIREAAGSICSILKSNGCRSHKTPETCNCGLHVAIGRTWTEDGQPKAADGYQISKYVVFWNHPQNRDFLKAFTRRWGCGYCQPKPEKAVNPEDSTNQSRLIVNQDRYELINLQNSNRIEVRAFRGTTNAKTLRACVSLTVWLWRYCSKPEITGDDLTSVKFIEWARTASVTDSEGVTLTPEDMLNYYDGRANK